MTKSEMSVPEAVEQLQEDIHQLVKCFEIQERSMRLISQQLGIARRNFEVLQRAVADNLPVRLQVL